MAGSVHYMMLCVCPVLCERVCELGTKRTVLLRRIELIARLAMEGARHEKDWEIESGLNAEVAKGKLIKSYGIFLVFFASLILNT